MTWLIAILALGFSHHAQRCIGYLRSGAGTQAAHAIFCRVAELEHSDVALGRSHSRPHFHDGEAHGVRHQ